MKSLNLNADIKVKLTPLGVDIYFHKNDHLIKPQMSEETKKMLSGKMPRIDEDGFTAFYLWEFMQIFGNKIGLGMPNVIEPINIVFDEDKIDEVT